jgi:AraC family transcriptional regulator, arabinose operon regulatory protein
MKKKEGFEGQRSLIIPQALLNEVADHPLCQGLRITDIGFYPKARFHHRERKKGSSQHILIYCVQGEGWYQHQRERYTVKANQLFLLPALEPHRYGSDATHPWSIYWLHFTGSQAEAFMQYLQGANAGPPLTVVPNEERFRLFEDIFAHLSMSFNLDNIIYANACLPHWLASFREAVFKLAMEDDRDEAINRSIDFMKQHLEWQFTVQELAEQAGMSASHYSAVFRRKTQNSPVAFFTFLKMQRACQLLENTPLLIKEISIQLGFEDPYHFSRVFSNCIGMSPRQFRHMEKA